MGYRHLLYLNQHLLVVDYLLILQQELQQQVLEALVQDQIYKNQQKKHFLVR